ncbi:hypothetical protein HDU77_003379 [Chytriomyces hyalinus]|nr:hypothetical protein HDU77_003379 [Chytriomyces hyalinus]
MADSDNAGGYIVLGLILGLLFIFVLAKIRMEMEDQRLSQRRYLAFHGKPDSLTTKMNALEEKSERLKDALFVASSDSKPRGELRALLGDIYAIYAQLVELKNDCRLYEGRMHAVLQNMSSSSYDKVQRSIRQQPPQTQPSQVASSSSSAPPPGYSSVASEVV